jgi:hypothetical protein
VTAPVCPARSSVRATSSSAPHTHSAAQNHKAHPAGGRIGFPRSGAKGRTVEPRHYRPDIPPDFAKPSARQERPVHGRRDGAGHQRR